MEAKNSFTFESGLASSHLKMPYTQQRKSKCNTTTQNNSILVGSCSYFSKRNISNSCYQIYVAERITRSIIYFDM